MSLKNQLAVGLESGFVTAKRASKKMRPSRRKGKQNAAIKTVRQIVREVVGLSPLEKRLVDIYKIGIGNPDKRVYKISKKRVSYCLCVDISI
jgi:large subunit ribosomal protein L36e